MYSNKQVYFKRVTDNGKEPTRGSKYAAGYDLFSAYEYVVPPLGKEMIKTDISMSISVGWYGRIAPRSGLAWHEFLSILGGWSMQIFAEIFVSFFTTLMINQLWLVST